LERSARSLVSSKWRLRLDISPFPGAYATLFQWRATSRALTTLEIERRNFSLAARWTLVGMRSLPPSSYRDRPRSGR
jgi:hypothetical protein